MALRTTRPRTVAFALLCVACLLVAPATAMGMPGDTLSGDDDTSDGDGIGDALESGTSSTNSSGSGSSDSGSSDSGSTDSGTSDSGSTDSGTSSDTDSGSTDSGASDSGSSDSGSTDAGSDGSDSGSDESSAFDGSGDDGSGDDGSDGSESSSETLLTIEESVEGPTALESDRIADADETASLGSAIESTLDPGVDETGTIEDVSTMRLVNSLDTDDTTDTDEPASVDSSLERTTRTVVGSADDLLSGVSTITTLDDDPVRTTGSVASPDVAVRGTDAPDRSSPEGTTDRSRFDAATTVAAVAGDGTWQAVGTGGGGVPVPSDSRPAVGFAVGLGAAALAAAGRQGSLLSGPLATVGTTLSAGLAPVASVRSGALERLSRMLSLFRYSRYDDSDPLEHEARSEVFGVVEDAPGAYLSEVAEKADLPLSTARHHVRVLEREDLLTGAKVRGKRRFYPAYSGDIEIAAALNDDSTAAVLDALARLGASSVSDIANELGRDPSTVTHHLQRLEEDDLVVREREGRAVMNRLSSEARTALDPETESPETEPAGAVAGD